MIRNCFLCIFLFGFCGVAVKAPPKPSRGAAARRSPKGDGVSACGDASAVSASCGDTAPDGSADKETPGIEVLAEDLYEVLDAEGRLPHLLKLDDPKHKRLKALCENLEKRFNEQLGCGGTKVAIDPKSEFERSLCAAVNRITAVLVETGDWLDDKFLTDLGRYLGKMFKGNQQKPLWFFLGFFVGLSDAVGKSKESMSKMLKTYALLEWALIKYVPDLGVSRCIQGYQNALLYAAGVQELSNATKVFTISPLLEMGAPLQKATFVKIEEGFINGFEQIEDRNFDYFRVVMRGNTGRSDDGKPGDYFVVNRVTCNKERSRYFVDLNLEHVACVAGARGGLIADYLDAFAENPLEITSERTESHSDSKRFLTVQNVLQQYVDCASIGIDDRESGNPYYNPDVAAEFEEELGKEPKKNGKGKSARNKPHTAGKREAKVCGGAGGPGKGVSLSSHGVMRDKTATHEALRGDGFVSVQEFRDYELARALQNAEDARAQAERQEALATPQRTLPAPQVVPGAPQKKRRGKKTSGMDDRSAVAPIVVFADVPEAGKAGAAAALGSANARGNVQVYDGGDLTQTAAALDSSAVSDSGESVAQAKLDLALSDLRNHFAGVHSMWIKDFDKAFSSAMNDGNNRFDSYLKDDREGLKARVSSAFMGFDGYVVERHSINLEEVCLNPKRWFETSPLDVYVKVAVCSSIAFARGFEAANKAYLKEHGL